MTPLRLSGYFGERFTTLDSERTIFHHDIKLRQAWKPSEGWHGLVNAESRVDDKRSFWAKTTKKGYALVIAWVVALGLASAAIGYAFPNLSADAANLIDVAYLVLFLGGILWIPRHFQVRPTIERQPSSVG